MRRLLLLPALLLLALVAPRGAAALEADVTEWKPCGGELECARARVPLDYDRPRGRRISLALARLPATGPGRRIGSLFINPGGPGSYGIDDLRDSGEDFAELNRRFDVVSFDPRGVGASRPAIDCITDARADALFAQVPQARVSRLKATARLADEIARGCRKRTPRFLLSHLATADVARDLNLLRRAVGDRRLSYLGFSYGTEIGSVYASLFPDRVRALALDAAINHRRWVRSQPADAISFVRAQERSLQRFFEFCAADKASCPFDGAQPEAAFDALARRLAADPISGAPGDPRPVDEFTLRTGALGAMYAPELWPLAGIGLQQADNGDGALVQYAADTYLGRLDDGTYLNSFEAYIAISANDGPSPRRLRPYRAHIRRLREASPHFAQTEALIDLARRTLPMGEDRYSGPLAYPGSAPELLVIGGTGDNATPYGDAVALVRQLGNARLLTRKGLGHISYDNSDCARKRIIDYLINRKLPPKGTRCASN